jgi:CRISPR-associated endonuclease/helicase Cas3
MWVMDEIQLMGNGLATTTQMEAFRNTLGTVFPARSVWMSATLQKEWLKTIDFMDGYERLVELRLSGQDKNHPSAKRLIEAKKPIRRAKCSWDQAGTIADFISDVHRRETRTLVVVNTVRRAVEIYEAVRDRNTSATLALVHSRFRPLDRMRSLARILAPPEKGGTICISTQVVEAGVDISATTLITDLAPWTSMVQRFGRCNRYGDDHNARVFWLDLDLTKKSVAAPYAVEELAQAATLLSGVQDVGIESLPQFREETIYKHVVRRKDIVELFDTTPDLAGSNIDVSRFIRETADHDVQVFWRDLPKEGPGEEEPGPARAELCNVSLVELNKVDGLDKWYFDHLEKRWVRPRNISPGMILMLRVEGACYCSEKGWTGNKGDIPEPLEPGGMAEEANDDDYYSATTWQTLADHTDAMVRELERLLDGMAFPDGELRRLLLLSARWHDRGKAHDVCQQAFLGDPPLMDSEVVWAKTARRGIRYERRGFRHELASALAMLENGFPNLAAYLVASHHGKVRIFRPAFCPGFMGRRNPA